MQGLEERLKAAVDAEAKAHLKIDGLQTQLEVKSQSKYRLIAIIPKIGADPPRKCVETGADQTGH